MSKKSEPIIYGTGGGAEADLLFQEVKNLPVDLSNLVFVRGGDGTMLNAIKAWGREGRAFFGVNFGTVGFLMNRIRGGDEQAFLRDIRDGRFSVHEFATLKATVSREKDPLPDSIPVIVNDFTVEREDQTAHLRVYVDGTMIVWDLACDGIIVSTPLGSTAYNHSAGGSLCLPNIPVMLLTPISPYKPRLKPLVLPLTSTVRIQVLQGDKRPTKYSVDGRYVHKPVRETVVTAGDPVKFAFLEGHDFAQHLVDRVLLT